MKITFVTLGSRGDVQPFIALARGLEAAGHEAVVATQAPFEQLVTSQGVRFAKLGNRFDAVEQFEDFSRRYYEAGRRVYKIIRQSNQWIFDLLDDQMAGAEAACKGADVIVEGTMGMLVPHLAELYDVPFARAYLRPETRTGQYRRPDLVYPESRFAWRRRGSYSLVMMSVWSLIRSRVNAWRAERGLDPWSLANPTHYHHYTHRFPVLLGYSERIARREPDYPEWHHITGFWTLDAARDYVAPDALAAFLDAGPKPVSLGFGSIPVMDPGAMWDVVAGALERTEERAVILTGWGGLERRIPHPVGSLASNGNGNGNGGGNGHRPAPAAGADADDASVPRHPADRRDLAAADERWFVIDQAPHDWLYPRSSMAIHHGGAGASAASFRAGVPTVIVPFLWDQAFWGHRAHALGVGPLPIRQGELDVNRLADAIRAARAPSMVSRAHDLGQVLGQEDGVGRAVRLLEETATAGRIACLRPA